MEDEKLLPNTLESIMNRIGYGKYHIAVSIVCLLAPYCLGAELILAGVYEKYLINETDLSDTTISTLCTLINSGISIGAAMAFSISHLLGRILILKIGYIIIILGVVSSSLVIDPITFCILRTIANCGIGISISISIAYLIESGPCYSRGYFGVALELLYNTGEIVILGLTYFLMRDIDGKNWFWVVCTPYIFIFIAAFILFFYLRESPWYLSKTGRIDELIETLEFISKQNTGKRLSEEEIDVAKNTKVCEFGFWANLKILFETKQMVLLLKIIWIRTCLIIGFAGSIFFIPFLLDSRDFYLSYIVSIIPAFPFMIIFTYSVEHEYFGRRKSVFFSFIISLLLSLVLLFFTDNDFAVALIIGCIGGLTSVCNALMAVYITEIYEIRIRVSASSIITIFSRLQLLYIVPVLILLIGNRTLMFSLFAVIYASGALTMYLMPRETRGKSLKPKI